MHLAILDGMSEDEYGGLFPPCWGRLSGVQHVEYGGKGKPYIPWGTKSKLFQKWIKWEKQEVSCQQLWVKESRYCAEGHMFVVWVKKNRYDLDKLCLAFVPEIIALESGASETFTFYSLINSQHNMLQSYATRLYILETHYLTFTTFKRDPQ